MANIKTKNPVADIEQKFKDLLLYLGQLEFNIINTAETLDQLQREKSKVMEELQELEDKIAGSRE